MALDLLRTPAGGGSSGAFPGQRRVGDTVYSSGSLGIAFPSLFALLAPCSNPGRFRFVLLYTGAGDRSDNRD